MKKILVQKLFASLLSSVVMGIACSIIFFIDDYFWLFAIYGSVIFLFIYTILGTPTSYLIDLLAQRIKQSGVSKTILTVVMYILGGVIVTILFFVLTKRGNINRFFSKEMIIFYELGITGSLLFLIIETTIKKFFSK